MNKKAWRFRLQDLGIAVETCGDIRMAQARLDDQHFDAIVLDCQNEGAAMDLIVHTRSQPTNQATVVIAIVGNRESCRRSFWRRILCEQRNNRRENENGADHDGPPAGNRRGTFIVHARLVVLGPAPRRYDSARFHTA